LPQHCSRVKKQPWNITSLFRERPGPPARRSTTRRFLSRAVSQAKADALTPPPALPPTPLPTSAILNVCLRPRTQLLGLYLSESKSFASVELEPAVLNLHGPTLVACHVPHRLLGGLQTTAVLRECPPTSSGPMGYHSLQCRKVLDKIRRHNAVKWSGCLLSTGIAYRIRTARPQPFAALGETQLVRPRGQARV